MRAKPSVCWPCLCGVLLVAWGALASEKGNGFSEITYDDLAKAVKDKTVTLLDVNGAKSFEKSRIPGAIDFTARKDDLKDVLPKEKDALIVAYCGGPKCGAWQRGAKAAQALGYTNVKHFKEGLAGWFEKCELKKSSCGEKKSCCGGCVESE